MDDTSVFRRPTCVLCTETEDCYDILMHGLPFRMRSTHLMCRWNGVNSQTISVPFIFVLGIRLPVAPRVPTRV